MTLLREKLDAFAGRLALNGAQQNLEFRATAQIGFLRLWWHVAAVRAIELGNNIFLAVRAIHIYSVSLLHYSLGVALSPTISFGNRYSFPAEPKSTRINLRPKFSISPTKVPCRGKRTPVLCDRISFAVLSESPVFMTVLFGSRLCATPVGKKYTDFSVEITL